MRAVVNPDNTRTIYGVSTDSKPTTTVDGIFDLEVGDTFYESNTGAVYMWTGSAWVEQ
jgi:hypothetical protein